MVHTLASSSATTTTHSSTPSVKRPTTCSWVTIPTVKANQCYGTCRQTITSIIKIRKHSLSAHDAIMFNGTHSRIFKRYYHNSFLDSQRQEAYNLFLGNYTYRQGQPMLWDLSTDYYLHHQDPKAFLERTRRDYVQWYTLSHLQALLPQLIPRLPASRGLQLVLG